MRHRNDLSLKVLQVKILLRGIPLFGSSRRFLTWLETPCGLLEGKTPLSLLTSAEGIVAVDTVMDIIEQDIDLRESAHITSGTVPDPHDE